MRFVIPLLILVIFSSSSYSQQSFQKNSVALSIDTTKVDTTRKQKDTTNVSGVDTVVVYSSSDSIVYSLDTKTMSLYKNGNIKYQKMELQSERIDIDWNTSEMVAFGVVDTSDTTHKAKAGTPIMKDAGEVYNGKELGYNFKTKRGRIQVADTKMDEGFYHGEHLKKVGSNVLFVADGRYTTCDKPDPDYYFFSPKMKVTLQDKVIAEPIYMYISDVPVFWFPVAVFPNKGGRRSGIIAPAIAEDPVHGRLLRHVGYYWAMNDYMDVSFRTDLYTKGSWAILSNYQYNLRYYFSGGFAGEYRKMLDGESSDPGSRKVVSYFAHIFHNQEINPTARFNVDFTFASNNSYQKTIDLNQALRQDITSNATLSKNWEGTPNSMSINISRRQTLTNGNINETLPSINFNHSQSYPFRFGKKESSNQSDLSWYEMIGMNYNANFTNNRAKTKQIIGGIVTTINGRDTTKTVEDYEFDRNYRIGQGVSMNIAPKLGYFTISPSMSYSDERTFTNNDVPDTLHGALIKRNDRMWGRRGTFSSGVAVSTKLYGIIQPNMLGISGIRHTMSPNLSFTYTKQVIGDNLARKQMMVNLNVGNNFEMKIKSSEEGKEDKKIQLMNIGAGISYNFAADSMRFSDIGVGFRSGIANVFNVGGGANFDLYKKVLTSTGYRDINKFLINEEGRLARLKNFSLSLSTTLAGEKKKSEGETSSSDTTVHRRSQSGYRGLYREEEDPDFSIPWQLSLSWDFSENKEPGQRFRSSNLRGNLEFNLTENWKFYINGGYDVINKQVVVPQIVISRDLHCWIMNFSWVPVGNYRSYQFEIRMKAPQLQDIKITKSGSASGIY